MIDIILYALWVDEEYSFIYLLFSSLLFLCCFNKPFYFKGLKAQPISQSHACTRLV